MERWNLVKQVVQQATLIHALTAEAKISSERDEAILSAMPSSERRKLELSIRKLHHNCGHLPNHVLVRMLRWKGAKENVQAAARLQRCSACVRNPCQRVVSTQTPGELPVVTWRSGITPGLKREQCTCGHASMKPQNSQLDTSGRKSTSLAVV